MDGLRIDLVWHIVDIDQGLVLVRKHQGLVVREHLILIHSVFFEFRIHNKLLFEDNQMISFRAL